MNSSPRPSAAAKARIVVDELIANGVTHAVLCPGSRSAPLAFALHQAERAGRLNLHVRIDERSAGFLAVGLAKATGAPVLVACTSGTAVANLHPAVLEAVHGRVPVIVVTADRPAELLHAGASQTVKQQGILGIATFEVPPTRPGREDATWRSLMCRAAAVAREAQPVHVNVPFEEPLVPEDDSWPASSRPVWTRTATSTPVLRRPAGLPGRTLVVLGDDRPERLAAAASLGWPVVAEPIAPGGLRGGSLLLAGPVPPVLRPDAVVVVGRPTLARSVRRLLTEVPFVHVVGDPGAWADTEFGASVATTWLPEGAVDLEWKEAWQRAARYAGGAIDGFLAGERWPTGLHVARDLVEALPPEAALFVGASNAIRDVDFAAPRRSDIRVYANRGVAGIDGNTSTAAGVAIAHGSAYALVGDVTFLHDLNGLSVGHGEPAPNLTIVVLNDDGGGIFSLLEQGAPRHAESFERIFGTPHGADLAGLCAGYRVGHVVVESADAFKAALARPSGLRVIEVRAGREGLRDVHERLRAAVSAALERLAGAPV